VRVGSVPVDVGRDLDPRADPHAIAVIVVQPLAGGDVLHKAVVILPEAAHLDRDVLMERQIQRSQRQLAIEPAVADLRVAAEVLARLAQDHVDRAAGGVAAEQCALRPAQHFDPLDVEQRQVVGVLPGQIDVVDIGPDRRIEGCDRFGIAEAAQEVSIGRTDAGIALRLEVGNELPQLQRVVDALRAKLVRGKAEIAIGTSCTLSARRCAVTTMSWIPLSAPGAAAPTLEGVPRLRPVGRSVGAVFAPMQCARQKRGERGPSLSES
jgi:hypothetical protein